MKFVPKGPIDKNRRQVITWTNADTVYWRIYAALGGDGLIEYWLLLKQAVVKLICLDTIITT